VVGEDWAAVLCDAYGKNQPMKGSVVWVFQHDALEMSLDFFEQCAKFDFIL
jgi:hypothetical protein